MLSALNWWTRSLAVLSRVAMISITFKATCGYRPRICWNESLLITNMQQGDCAWAVSGSRNSAQVDTLFAAALPGDVMKKLDTGGLFDCEDPAVDGPRVERFEISPAGPMFGHKLRPASHEALAREERLLAQEGIALDLFARGGGEAEGTRRAARLRVEIGIEPFEGGYRAAFELPKGSYATVVMREIVKGEAELGEGDEA